MSAERLREAATLMRQRAEHAADELGGPATDRQTWRGIGTGYREPIKDHIASWHPAGALAVADWLEVESGKWDSEAERYPSFAAMNHAAALAVANAYLGSDQ